MEFESKLIPIMREGIDVIKMITYQKLKVQLISKHPGRSSTDLSMLSGAIINDLFGITNTEEPFSTFRERNRASIHAELEVFPKEFEDMRDILTDALRVQFLCDSQEGIDSLSILSRAKELGILLADREVPLPNNFLNLVRRMGTAFNLLAKTSIANA